MMLPVVLGPGDHECTVEVGDRLRRYLLHVPASTPAPEKWPVVFCFHGGGSNPEQMSDFTGLSELADARGFVVVYPAGTGIIESALTWNAGNCCGRAHRLKVDEVAFITALLDDLQQRIAVDEHRIYATGMSNGAMMSYLMADRLSERFAAIGPVGGPMGFETCSPSVPVPVIHFHGTADEFAPYIGGVGRRSVSKTNFVSVEHTIEEWVRANNCELTPITEELVLGKEDAPTRITRYSYRPLPGGAEVVLYQLHDIGHTWPGRQSRFKALGAVTKDIQASEVMWDFFTKYTR